MDIIRSISQNIHPNGMATDQSKQNNQNRDSTGAPSPVPVQPLDHAEVQGETQQDTMVLAPHVLNLPFVCGKTLAKE